MDSVDKFNSILSQVLAPEANSDDDDDENQRQIDQSGIVLVRRHALNNSAGLLSPSSDTAFDYDDDDGIDGSTAAPSFLEGSNRLGLEALEMVRGRVAAAAASAHNFLKRYKVYGQAAEIFQPRGVPFKVLLVTLGVVVLAPVVLHLLEDHHSVGYYSYKRGQYSEGPKVEPYSVVVDGKFDMVMAAKLWDQSVGCAKFRSKHHKLLDKFLKPGPSLFPPNPSLQDPYKHKCRDLQLRHVIIFVPDGAASWLGPNKLENYFVCERCGVTCQITWQESMASQADAKLFVWPREPPPGRKKREPLRVFINLESWGLPAEKTFFDIGVSFHSSSDVQLTYAGIEQSFKAGHQANVSRFKFQDALAFRASSHCQYQWREDILRSLLALIPHHSFGSCDNNVNGTGAETRMFPECTYPLINEQKQEITTCAMSHYKFQFAMENTHINGYLTEKSLSALSAGTIPIYYGAADAENFLPPDSYIPGDRMSVTEVAALVMDLHRNPVKFMDYFAWRTCGVFGNFAHTLALGFDSLPCRLCEAVSAAGGRLYTKPKQADSK